MKNFGHRTVFYFTVTLFLVSPILFSGCAHKKRGPEPVTLNQLQNKRVAIVDIRGASESRSHVEVAIINEIADKGRFQVVDRESVQDALTIYPTDSDWQRLGKKIGADYLLSVRLVDFTVTERKGYDKLTEEDSLLTQENGEKTPVKGTRYVKVKSNEGNVKISAIFYDVADGAITYQGTGAANQTFNSREGQMPGKMTILESLTASAIRDFFEKIPSK